MRRYARMTKALGTVLMTAGLLLAGTPGAAGAAEIIPLPQPAPPVLLSATVSGCEAPCAPDETGEVTITFTLPDVPPGAPEGTVARANVFADGRVTGRTPTRTSASGNTRTYTWVICTGIAQPPFSGCGSHYEVDAIRGAEEFTVTAQFLAWSDDPIQPEIIAASPVSEPSNALVPTQL